MKTSVKNSAKRPAKAAGAAADRQDGSKGYLLAYLDETQPVSCSCGSSRRAFGVPGNDVATLHVVDISRDAQLHYHKRMTEIYYILEGEGHVQLDDEKVPVRPGATILIRPGTRHRAIGKLKVIVVPIPAYDPDDEHFD